MSDRAERFVRGLLDRADISIGGSRPQDIHIHDKRFFGRILSYGTLGLGEAYMDGWWDANELDVALSHAIRADMHTAVRIDWGVALSALRGRLTNLQRWRKSEVAEFHYDLGNDLFTAMLDPRLVYSCAYWARAETLGQAQEDKLDLICRKIGLEPGMRVLDIGSGWGGFLKFAAERYGIEGLGITISREQAEYANAHSQGLRIETRLMDYMSLTGPFDRIVSVGMFEHVGYKNYRRYLEKVRSLLAPDGLFLLHTIAGNFTTTHGDPWSEKYIFPNGMLPSVTHMGQASEGVFVIEDWHNFGADYDRTLMAWHANFEAHWPRLEKRYGKRFYRMWRYYLLSFAAMFRERQLQLWQLVMSPNGVPGGYRSVR